MKNRTMTFPGIDLSHWRESALEFERALNSVVLGLETPVRSLTIAVFSRGHVLLEGDVGVGKTTCFAPRQGYWAGTTSALREQWI